MSLTCRQASEKIAHSEALSAWMRVQLWFHLAICDACRAFRKLVRSIRAEAKAELQAKFSEAEVKRLRELSTRMTDQANAEENDTGDKT